MLAKNCGAATAQQRRRQHGEEPARRQQVAGVAEGVVVAQPVEHEGRIGQRRAHEVAGRVAELAVEDPGLVRAAVEVRHDDPVGDEEPHHAERQRGQADPALTADGEDDPEDRHGDGDVLLPRQGGDEGDPVPPPLPPRGQQVGGEEERDGHRLGVPGLPAQPLHGRVEQPGDAEGEGLPLVAEAVAGVEEDRHRRQPERRRLQQVEQLRPAAQPVQRGDGEVGERHVVPEHRHPADRDEALAVGSSQIAWSWWPRSKSNVAKRAWRCQIRRPKTVHQTAIDAAEDDARRAGTASRSSQRRRPLPPRVRRLVVVRGDVGDLVGTGGLVDGDVGVTSSGVGDGCVDRARRAEHHRPRRLLAAPSTEPGTGGTRLLPSPTTVKRVP